MTQLAPKNVSHVKNGQKRPLRRTSRSVILDRGAAEPMGAAKSSGGAANHRNRRNQVVKCNQQYSEQNISF